MKYTLNQIIELSKQIELKDVFETNSCAFEGMKSVGENLNILIITTHHTIARSFIKNILNVPVSLIKRVYPCELEINRDTTNYFSIETEMGLVKTTESSFISQLCDKRKEQLKAKLSKDNFEWNNVYISFIYISDFASISYNEWVYKLSAIDKVYYILDGLQVFNNSEKIFVDNVLNKIFSSQRMSLVIGNTLHLEESEKNEVIEYSKEIAKDKTHILISDFSTDQIDPLHADITKISNDSLSIRTLLEEEITDFAYQLLINSLPKYKEKLIKNSAIADSVLSLLSKNSDAILKSKERLSKKIDSFINEYVYIQFNKRINEFDIAFIDSISEDIHNSSNIEKESKILNHYIEFVWSRFMANQDSWLKSSVMSEISDIEKIMNNDLDRITTQLDVQSQQLIKNYSGSKYQIHSYLIGKEGKSDIGELSKTMKIGALILALFAPLAAILTFGGSELLKKVFQNKIEEGQKEHLIVAVESMSKQIKGQILQQSKNQLKIIADKLTEQTFEVYDNILCDFEDALKVNVFDKEKSNKILSIIETI